MARNTKKGTERLEARRRAYDASSGKAKQGTRRPGSTNAHKGTTAKASR